MDWIAWDEVGGALLFVDVYVYVYVGVGVGVGGREGGSKYVAGLGCASPGPERAAPPLTRAGAVIGRVF